jgi:hypothetical protein
MVNPHIYFNETALFIVRSGLTPGITGEHERLIMRGTLAASPVHPVVMLRLRRLIIASDILNFIEKKFHLLIRERSFRYSHSSAKVIGMKKEVFFRLRPIFQRLP